MNTVKLLLRTSAPLSRSICNAPRQLAPALSFLLVVFVGCAASSGGGSGPPESLMMPFAFENGKLAWNPAHQDENAVLRVVEFVRPGETVDNWTELVTVQTFNKTVDIGSVESQVAAFRRDLAARCSGATLEAIPEHAAEFLYDSKVINCKAGADEYNLTRIIDGRANRFVLQYAVRGNKTMTPERRAEWITKLAAVRIMDFR